MRIGLFGDGKWAQLALNKILGDPNFEVSFLVPRYDKPDQVLIKIAETSNIPVLLHGNVNSIDFIEKLAKHNADIFVSMSFDQIFKGELIKLTPYGVINCHAGALPYYRGRNVLNWAIINGEDSFGVTVHYVDEGIDTGDIIIQKHVDIAIDDDYSTLLEKAYSNCADALYAALKLISQGNVQITKQESIHPVGFYCGRRIEGDELIDWNWNSRRIYDFIRAITVPGPCARTYLQKDSLAVVKSELIINAPNYIGTPGEVLSKDSRGIVIKTGDSTLRITYVAKLNNNVPVDFIVPKYKIGTRLG